jgi:hypothetical protein
VATAPNPFAFAGPVTPDDLIDRENELMSLQQLARGGHIARLEAPRRYGKTSLLGGTLTELAASGHATALVDFEDVLSLGAVVARIERAYSRSLKGSVRQAVDRLFRSWDLGLSLGAGGFAVALRTNPKLDPEVVLLRLLALPEQLHARSGIRTYVVFDEVQDLLRVRGADGMIRSVIQHHLGVASYAFAGSAPSLMSRLFDDPKAAFMDQGVRVTLLPLPSGPLGDYIERRFAESGKGAGEVLGELLAFCRGHPQRAMQLAHHLWERTEPSTSADIDTWLDARTAALAESERLLWTQWTALPLNEQRAAAALAVSPSSPATKEIRGLVGLNRNSAYSALDNLVGRGEAIETGSGLRLTDPLLELWLRERGAP